MDLLNFYNHNVKAFCIGDGGGNDGGSFIFYILFWGPFGQLFFNQK